MAFSVRSLNLTHLSKLVVFNIKAVSGSTTIRKSSNFSIWPNVEMNPPDANFQLNEAYKADPSENKVNLALTGYRDNDGKPWILPSVRAAKKKIHDKKLDKEYAPILGYPDYTRVCAELAFGEESSIVSDCLNATVASVAETGALRIGGEFFAQWYEPSKIIYVPDPTWNNHRAVFTDAGLDVRPYRYYNPSTLSFDFEGCMEDLSKLPEKSVVLLHASAHNPTGSDPKPENWREMCKLFKNRKLMPFFDMAYQGFASGDLDKDAFAVRHFVCRGIPIAVAQSFSNNFGLYGERVGTFTLVNRDRDETNSVLSQLKVLIKPMYSTPPINGMRIVTHILSSKEFRTQWVCDVKTMAERIICIRRLLVNHLTKLKSPHEWTHLTNQIGMLSYTGLTQEQVERLIKEYHVYLTKDGKISLAGLNTKNVEYVAHAINEVTKDANVDEIQCE